VDIERLTLAHASVAVFDVVKSARRTSPFVLLQPHLRLRDIFPRHRDYPNDETAFVGLVPETGSLFALSPNHFPLVAFGEPEPTQGVERIEASSEDGVPLSHEHDKLQCYGGSTDRRCLTGVRTLVADSHSRLARLLDGVPGPAVPPLPTATGTHARPGNTNSQSYAASEPVVTLGKGNTPVVPWEWLANISESMAPRQSSWVPSSSALLLTLASAVASLLWFKRKAPREAPYADKVVHPNTLAGNSVSVSPLGNAMHISPQRLHAVESRSETKATLAKNTLPMSTTHESSTVAPETVADTPVPPPATDDGAKSSPAKAESPEGAEDGGEVKKKHRKRRRRRKGETKDATAEVGDEPENEDADGGEDGNVVLQGSPSLVPPPTPAPPASLSLVVSDTVLGTFPSLLSCELHTHRKLGHGSHGTIVYEGSLQGRAVAVKRLLRDFVTLAHREVSLLKDADDHPNVIRYFYQEAHADFLYIALELCPASLADIIERPDQFRDIYVSFSPKRAVRQITSGLRHLHALKIVHRDIKPQNILISGANKGGESSGHRMLISDFGLCRKLDSDQTSFLPTAGSGAMGGVGTFGWRAPEILRGEVKLDEPTGIADDNSQSSRGSVETANGNSSISSNPQTTTGASKPPAPKTRLTKSVDVFALGCLYYYCLTNGGHPFGDRFEREFNILRDHKSLQALEIYGEEGSEAMDLINSMLAPEAADRWDTLFSKFQIFGPCVFSDPGAFCLTDPIRRRV
jgi:serine/threonine-protein kinase/endoribonuclease IRE1